MRKTGNKGLKRIINACVFSFNGLKACYQNEEAFRQELLLAMFLLPLAVYLTENAVERALLISAVMLVLIVELLNTAVEVVVDRFGGEQHELSGMAKDVASAAVFVSLFNGLMVWLLILAI